MKTLPVLCLALLLSNFLSAKEIKVSTTSELIKAVESANAGDRIYLKQGRYAFDATLTIKRDGSALAMISLLDDPTDAGRPLFDFSALPEKSSSNGLLLKASYWHIKGIDVTKAGHNGLKVQGGSHNLIEYCTFSQCRDTGLQLSDGASQNTVLNCDSFENSDSKKENADGFACKMDVGTGNKFVGCRSWNNMDDGWDGYLRGVDSVTTSYENCWAFLNGISKEGVISGGDGNGFKTGGSDDKTLKHNAVYIRCIAAANVADGFDHNSNRGNVTIYHCVAHNNKRNMAFLKDNPLSKLTVKNSIVHGPVGKLFADSIDINHNSWQAGAALKDDDFRSVDVKLLLLPRKVDGSLPDISYLVPIEVSHR
ncbi:right-handed parallel beta-helix repeat-containing protein [Botryobacter ruber]|uniref:right-handed parallel beta-helix repeat-containing protein n=1 Tax=Botryobacter ruber TaxID=2171629 RepID=UPI0013E354D1|nr:right-handed parallel beta-helix repeat-containing protein [Botryobacter ruber]